MIIDSFTLLYLLHLTKLDVSHSVSSFVLAVSIPMDNTMLSGKATDIVTQQQTFDVIMGMEWLSTYYSKLDCFQNKETFHAYENHMVMVLEKYHLLPLYLLFELIVC